MKQRKGVFTRLAEAVDLPGEPVPGVTLVEIAGDTRVLIENHHGVCAYGDTDIRVLASYGQVCVQGTGLVLVKMTDVQLVIRGKILSVSLRGRC